MQPAFVLLDFSAYSWRSSTVVNLEESLNIVARRVRRSVRVRPLRVFRANVLEGFRIQLCNSVSIECATLRVAVCLHLINAWCRIHPLRMSSLQ